MKKPSKLLLRLRLELRALTRRITADRERLKRIALHGTSPGNPYDGDLVALCCHAAYLRLIVQELSTCSRPPRQNPKKPPSPDLTSNPTPPKKG